MSEEAHRSCLEVQMYGYLKEIGVEFAEQVPLRTGFVTDFIVTLYRPDGSKVEIDIETDGSEFHSTKNKRRADLMRDKSMYALGLGVLRFREGFTGHQVYGSILQFARRNGVVDFPKCPESFGD